MSQRLSHPAVEFSTLVELLRWRALRQPDRSAYTFLVNGGSEEVSLTYRELDQQARAIGALLQRHAAPAERALLLYPPGLEFIAAFFGCLYAGVLAVPAYPPHPGRLDRSLPKLRAMANNAQPVVALTTSGILSTVESVLAQAPDFPALRYLATDNLTSDMAETWRDPAISSDTLAFLQYTSGSTAAPKGVMVSHSNLMYNERMIQRAFEHTEASTFVNWLPPYHDMGLIGNIIQPLYIGALSVLMAPVAFLQRPYRWLHAISRYRATTSGAPNFAYDLCVRKITPEQRLTLDLSCLSLAYNGSEPVRQQTLEQFTAAFAPCGFRPEAFYPCYGMAETTLFVSGGLKSDPPIVYTVQGSALEQGRVVATSVEDENCRRLVGCGRTWLDQKLAIVDPDSLTSCPPDRVGEIWVSGPNVAQGYWNQPDETERTFRAYLADTGEGPYLRTGDLGFLKDGELFVTGRIKDLIIIGGVNHYPQDIEWTVEQSHPAIRPGCCAAFSVDGPSEEQLVVVAEVERRYRPTQRQAGVASDSESPRQPLDSQAVVRAIRRAVAEEHDVPVHSVMLLKTGSIPKTSSGKIQRHACRAAFLAGALNVIEE